MNPSSSEIDNDDEVVANLIGRKPMAAFTVVVRDETGAPIVIENDPFCYDASPMPTRFWLVGKKEVAEVGRIEAGGGVDRAEAEINASLIAQLHDRYARERDSLIDSDHEGPRPSGGVGGTRVGVKCLHAHVAHYLATHDDVVGEWTLAQINAEKGNDFRTSFPGKS